MKIFTNVYTHTHKVERKNIVNTCIYSPDSSFINILPHFLTYTNFLSFFFRDNWSLKFKDMCSRGEILWIVLPWYSPTLPLRTQVSILLP